ncbi:MAG: hypothetical protein SPL51_04840 [Lachnospiraceae bacterium]|nr:hypothetical protein [Lachnospiraceae bacterium]
MKSFIINIFTFLITTVALLVVSTNTYADEITDFTKIDIHISVRSTSDKLDKNLSYQLKSAEGRVYFVTLLYRYEIGSSYTNVVTRTYLYSDYKFTLNSSEVVNTCNGPNGLRYFWFADMSVVGITRGQKVVASNTQYYVDINKYNPNVYDNQSVNDTVDSIIMNFLTSGKMSDQVIDMSNREWNSEGEPIESGLPIRDIETPKNVKVLHTKNMDRWDFRINWDIPEMNNHHYYVNIHVADYLKFKKFAWQNYHNFTVGWHPISNDTECAQGYYLYKIDEDIACHEGLANAWKKEYGGDKMSLSKAKSYFNMEGSLLGASKHDFVKKWKYPGITIQFWYRDEKGRMHTSNYVQITDLGECDGYVANELSKFDYLNDGNSGEIADTDNNVTDKVVDNSSGNYDGSSDVMHDNNEDIEEKSAIEILKSMMRDLKSFPNFFVEFFSFLPGQVSQYLYALIIVMIPLVLLKIVRG